MTYFLQENEFICISHILIITVRPVELLMKTDSICSDVSTLIDSNGNPHYSRLFGITVMIPESVEK